MSEKNVLTPEQQQLVDEIMEKSSQNVQKRVDEMLEALAES